MIFLFIYIFITTISDYREFFPDVFKERLVNTSSDFIIATIELYLNISLDTI